MDVAVPLLQLFAASLVLPTAIYLAWRSRHPSRTWQRIAGWWCLWGGQLTVLMILSAWEAVSVGQGCIRAGYVLAGVIYGGLGALFAGFAAVHAARLFQLGLSILRSGDPSTIRLTAMRLQKAVAIPFIGCLALHTLASSTLPMPGRWTALGYYLVVLLPLGFTASLVFVTSEFVSHIHKTRP